MRFIMPLTILGVGVAAAARADTEYSAMLRDTGLAGTEATLAALPDPTPSDQFALGGVRFLGTVETALQTLYATQINRDMAENSGLPFLRLPVGQNPEAAPFDPAMVAALFETALTELDSSLAALDTITDADAVAVTLDTADIWFDVNANGTRDEGEGFYDIAAPQLAWQLRSGMDTGFTPPVVRFDTADAAWLSAYAHLLSGVSETILALDPTTAITRVTESSAALNAFSNGYASSYITPDDAEWVDLIAMFIHAIEGQPDADRSRAAHAHFLSMIDDNQVFWARVAQETDNDMEWIPNKTQQSALPLDFPPETGDSWRMVLAEADAVLRGDLLIPHWRLGPTAGINLAEAMQNPPEIDLISIFQGETILPYAEEGPRMTGRSLQMFERMIGGDAGLYMVILN